MRLLAFILSSILFSYSCFTQATESHSNLKVGVESTDYSPYFYLDANANYQGAAREVIDLFSQQQKINLDYDAMPVPRLFSEFVKGLVDLKFPDNPLWSASLKSDVKVFYSQPVLPAREVVMVMIAKDSSDKEKVLAREVTQVGTILGFSVPGIETYIEKNQVERVDTAQVEQLIHMLANGRVQALYFNESVAKKIAKQLYPNKHLIRHPDFPVFKYAYHLSSINHPKLIEQFNEFLRLHSEQVADILSRHGI